MARSFPRPQYEEAHSNRWLKPPSDEPGEHQANQGSGADGTSKSRMSTLPILILWMIILAEVSLLGIAMQLGTASLFICHFRTATLHTPNITLT
jgi:hypothetical protein